MSNSVSKSDVVSLEATRRQLSDRQARTVAKLADAAVEELREHGYEGLTVRSVAARAGVAPATAYNHFTSKDHLITEVFWRRLAALPDTPVDRRQGQQRRVEAALADLALLVADEPELAAACTIAMLQPDPEVAVLRDRIGTEMHRRLAVALGPEVDPAVLQTLDFAVTGALVRAGVGQFTYADLPDRLAEVAALVLGKHR